MGRNAPKMVGDVTAEPRMEDLLASIRKAINEDIGPEVAPVAARGGAMRSGEEPSATSSEIQQLREKIGRSRSVEPASRNPAQRAASLAAALRSNTPRRAWRDIEPAAQVQAPPPAPPLAPQPAPRLRSTLIEPEAPARPVSRPEQTAGPQARFTQSERPAPAWTAKDRSEPPRENTRTARTDQVPILSGASAQSVQTAFSRLAETFVARAVNEQSIEDITREMLKPMLKHWLEENLPGMVERIVREEIERVARTGR